jgi:hypothetical protein
MENPFLPKKKRKPDSIRRVMSLSAGTTFRGLRTQSTVMIMTNAFGFSAGKSLFRWEKLPIVF